MSLPSFIKATGIYYPRELETFKRKKGIYLQPIFEAVTNAWEAIMDKFGVEHLNQGKIIIKLNVYKGLDLEKNSDFQIQTIQIEDNGIGLDEDNLNRLKNLRDPSKNHSNNGTGRVQFLFYFSSTIIESVSNYSGETSRRVKVTLSSNEHFLANNSIMRLDEQEEIDRQDSYTVVTFNNTIDPKDSKAYGALSAATLKTDIINHSLARFCDNRGSLPTIIIERYINNELDGRESISDSDIPHPEKEEDINVDYVTVKDKKIVGTDQSESFHLRSFVLPEHKVEGNKIFLVSKGELGNTLPLDNLSEKETIDGNRYMFLLSGDYLDARDSDDRGNINLMKEQELKKLFKDGNSFFSEEQYILKENLAEEVNHKISSIYDVFAKKEQEKEEKINELQEMFLLDPETVDAIRSKVKKSTTDAEILKMVYESEMAKVANLDASIKKAIKDIEALNPKKSNYQAELSKLVSEFSTKIPEQNKSALTKYIARRKLVLELFDKILHNELDCLRGGKRIDEDLLHNLIFRQHSTSPSSSDLWLLDDQYLYFSGCSEKELNDIKVNGKPLLKQELTDEENAYKYRQQKDVGERRPDIMLFPAEGKCIIIEFKAPNVDVSAHLDQINRYAMIIHNLSDLSIEFNTFYGYLIGEDIDYDAIQESNVYFKKAANLGYIYRPNYPLTGKFGHIEGDLYTEIIKYSDLLKRAQARNRIFIEKLEGLETE